MLAKGKAVLIGVGALLGFGGLAVAASAKPKRKAAGVDIGGNTYTPVVYPVDVPIVPDLVELPDGGFSDKTGDLIEWAKSTIDGGVSTAFQTPPTFQGPPTNTPAGRYASVRAGEGPYAFVTRVSGAQYAGRQPSGGWGWHKLESYNPGLVLNGAGDNYTTSSWYPLLSVRIPDEWPGGTAAIAAVA